MDKIIGKLKVGDIVVVSTILGGEKEYLVKKIEGNKAFTDFRIFNTKIYYGNQIYEYGKNCYNTTNGYWLKENP
ncbi:MAG: hypothetical protein ACFFG0_04470 [Candidatus Thorarchaeota archaeon]